MRRTGICLWAGISGLVVYVLLIGFVRDAKSEPSWARKYNSDCTLCHTIYPRLNRTGYMFKRLGYRFPSEIMRKYGLPTPSAEAKPSPIPSTRSPNSYTPTPWSEQAAQGKQLAGKFECATCHQIEGSGGRIGPPLDGVGGRRSPQFIREQIQDPSKHISEYSAEIQKGGQLMPRVNATAAEIDALAAYLLTLSYKLSTAAIPHPPATGQPALNPAYVPAEMTPSAEEGKKLYISAGCSACHSIAGGGGDAGPKLDGVGARRTPVWLMRHITNPEKHIEAQPEAHQAKTSMMPSTELTPVEIAKVVDFVLTLPATQEQETAAIPKNKIQHYFGSAWIPAVEMERSSGESSNTFVSREMNIYIAGTLGPNLSMFVQPTPAVDAPGLLNHFEMMQGSFNYGGAEEFLQVRFGQTFDLLNAGFAGSDRTITDSIPLLFESANGFNPGELMRGVSIEYTLKGLTTFKAFAGYQTAPGFDVEEGAPEFGVERSRTYGFVFEKVIGSKGLSGIQFQYAGGYTPISLAGQIQPALRFQRYSLFANKTFLDKRNVERFNLLGGVMALRDNRLLDAVTPEKSHGYGFFFETNWIPMRRLGVVARFDQLRATTLEENNTVRAESAAVIYDFTKYTRMMFEYQHRERSTATNLYRIGWQLNF